MRKRRVALVASICLAAVLVLTAYLVRDSEPYYQGRSLSEWGDRYWENVNGTDAGSLLGAKEARDAIRAIGPKALPILLRRFRYEVSAINYLLVQGSRTFPLFDLPAAKISSFLGKGPDPVPIFRALHEE